MSVQPTLTKREIAWLLSCCSKGDLFRARLQSVSFSGSFAYATNGHMIAQLTFPGALEAPILVPRGAFDRAAKMMSTKDVCTVEPGRLLIVSGTEEVAALAFAAPKDPFPPVEDAIKTAKGKSGPNGVALSAGYLAAACAIGALASDVLNGVWVQPGLTPLDVCKVSARNPNGRSYAVYIMPMRIDP